MRNRQVSTVARDGHQYVFRYQPGEEVEALDAIDKLASDGTIGQEDALTMSHKVGARFLKELKTALASGEIKLID